MFKFSEIAQNQTWEGLSRRDFLQVLLLGGLTLSDLLADQAFAALVSYSPLYPHTFLVSTIMYTSSYIG